MMSSVYPNSPIPTNLANVFVNFVEFHYSIDWIAIQRSVEMKLRLKTSFENINCNYLQSPSYWYVPLLIGHYVSASRKPILDDTEAFVTGCIIRHFIFESDCPFDPTADTELFHSISAMYDKCRIDSSRRLNLPFDELFSIKCLPWMFLLVSGTSSIFAEAEGNDYADAMRSIVLVHSCLQMIDDWHDKAEDIARSHWNMWVHEPVGKSLSVLEPLLRGAHTSVEHLRPHLLRRVLAAQLQDTANELRDVVTALNKT